MPKKIKSKTPTLKNVLKDLKSFPKDLKIWQRSYKKDVQSEFNEMEKFKSKDIDWRLKNRQTFRNFLFSLLLIQNLIVFSLFGLGLWFNKLSGLENLFQVLIAGTLIETTSVIIIIVKWLFSEIPYSQNEKK